MEQQIYSKAVTNIAGRVRSAFESYRTLVRKYQENIELVDPQLKNNAALVKVVSDFEDAWGLGQNQIGCDEHLKQLDRFSRLLDQTQADIP